MENIYIPPDLLSKFKSEYAQFRDADTRGVSMELLQYAVWLRTKIETDVALLLLLHDRKVTVTSFDHSDPAKSILDRTGDSWER